MRPTLAIFSTQYVPTEAQMDAHNRTIDHFKQVYAIIAGLALTEACLHVLPLTGAGDFRIPLFFTLLITVVPIFHGGDRSLDVKYRNHYPQTARDRAALLWDDYMLLLTAVLFVCIAEAIPKAPEPGHAPAEVHAQAFYHWMAIMLGFDVTVLVIDRWKSRAKERVRLKPYIAWIVINSLLGLVCGVVSGMSEPQGAGLAVTIPLPFGLSVAATLWQVSFAVFAAALLRTVADYEVEQGFLLARANRSFGA
jgi:hypothetical protein